MSQRRLYSNCRAASLAAVLALMVFTDGCSLWNAERWTLDRYRDQRAVDIERHLERSEPIVSSPF